MMTATPTHQDARSKEVFALRRAGDLDQALEKARAYYEETPQDVWLVRAYGWTLHDALKRANNQGDLQALQSLYEEFGVLDLAEDETLMRQKREEWLERIPVGKEAQTEHALLAGAKSASDAGRDDEALRLFREAVRSYPSSTRTPLALGWEIQRQLGVLLKAPQPDGGAIESLLFEYRQLPHHQRPGRLHSLILQRAAKAAKVGLFPAFPEFLQWWDPQFLQEEDYASFRPPNADRDFPGTVATAINALYRSVKKEQDPAKIRWAAEFIGTHIDRFPDEPWFPYYHGKLLAKSGHGDEARPLVLPIVKAKPNEFWVWDCLADTFGQDQVDMRLSCLCRALQCGNQKPEFLVNVHTELGALLVQQALFDEARYEIDQAIRIRRSKQWTVPSALLSRTEQPWYTKAKELPDNKALYAAHAPKADTFVLRDSPSKTGVVTGVNTDKELTAIKIGKDEVVLLLHRTFPEVAALKPGQPVKVWAEWDAKRERWNALGYEPCEHFPDSAFCKDFSGTLKRPAGRDFGFVEPRDIFCPPPVLSALSPDQGEVPVRGVAVLDYSERRQDYGWKAVRLDG